MTIPQTIVENILRAASRIVQTHESQTFSEDPKFAGDIMSARAAFIVEQIELYRGTSDVTPRPGLRVTQETLDGWFIEQLAGKSAAQQVSILKMALQAVVAADPFTAAEPLLNVAAMVRTSGAGQKRSGG